MSAVDGSPRPAQTCGVAAHRALDADVRRLRDLLETERRATAEEMVAGAAELGDLEQQLSDLQVRNVVLRRQVRRWRRRARAAEERLAEMSAGSPGTRTDSRPRAATAFVRHARRLAGTRRR